MYSSLHKIDIVANAPKGGSGKIFLQTDHRDAEEVAKELEVSVLFALARTLSPRRIPDGKDAVVRYVCLGSAHPALVEVVAATGAQLESVGNPVSLEGVRHRAPAEIADEAFAALGQRLLAERGLKADEAGLAAFEAEAAGAPADPSDEGEIEHWTAVAQLAAVTGEVLRARCGGRWVDDPKDYADIPFMFRIARGEQLVNPVGKAIKFLKHGAAESPRLLFKILEDAGQPEGPLLFSLKPSSWGGGETVCEPLMPGLEKLGKDIPVIVYGHDQPNTFALFKKTAERTGVTEEMRTEALANLARIDAEVQRVDLDQLTFWVVQGGYFAAEKILDVAFMKSMHERVKAPLLAAAVPAKGQLFLTDGVSTPERLLSFMAIARGVYQKNEGGRQLSPTVFLVSEGKLQGVASTSDEPPPSKKKGFFKRLFS